MEYTFQSSREVFCRCFYLTVWELKEFSAINMIERAQQLILKLSSNIKSQFIVLNSEAQETQNSKIHRPELNQLFKPTVKNREFDIEFPS